MGQAAHFSLWPNLPKDRIRSTQSRGVGHVGLKEIACYVIVLAHLTL